MKIWLKVCAQVRYKQRRIIRCVVSLFFFVLLIGLIYYITGAERRTCALCGFGDGIAYHAPCLLNLATGEMGEMKVFDYRPESSLELSERQQTGTFSFLYVDGKVSAYRDTCDHSSHATLPVELPAMKKRFFCRECQQLLSKASSTGYILADLFDLDAIQVFPVSVGAKYEIRNYSVSVIIHNESGRLSVDIMGHIENTAK